MEFIIYFTQRLFSRKYETGKLRILNHFIHKNMIKNTYLNFEKSVQSACIYKRKVLGWGDFVCPVWGRYSIGGWSRAVKAEAVANLAQGCSWRHGIGRERAANFRTEETEEYEVHRRPGIIQQNKALFIEGDAE
jgi:hypothetical protein